MEQKSSSEVGVQGRPLRFDAVVDLRIPVIEPVDIQINEYDRAVATGVYVQYGQMLKLSATGEIWAGVWFTGRNGPQGWAGWSASADYPLPYAAPFCLLGRLDARYFYIGTGKELFYLPPTGPGGASQLFLQINDNTPGNGWGAFYCHIEVYGEEQAPTVSPTGAEDGAQAQGDLQAQGTTNGQEALYRDWPPRAKE